MFFGLCNAPFSFQWMMAEMFKEEIATGKVFIYIDDVIIATKDLAEHHRLVYKVLQRFKENNLYSTSSQKNASLRKRKSNTSA
jgi:hypothetical protein